MFLPYLSGERSPHNNPQAQGVWFGLTHAHDAAALAYAVVEGVGFGLLDGYRTLALPGGTPVQALSLVGGGARSEWWAQLLASTLGVALRLHDGSEAGGALGAARLAWLADGGNLAGGVPTAPGAPRGAARAGRGSEGLVARHARFTRLYPALRACFSDT